MVDIKPFPEFMRIPNICNNEETDSSCSSVVIALVCQPSGPGSNPGGLAQSQLVQGEKPI